MKNKLYELRQYKPFRVRVWQVFNGFVTLLLAYVAGLDGERLTLVPLIYAFINVLTKWVNTTYFGDLGVEPVTKVNKF